MTAKSDIEQQLGAFRASTRLCSDQERTYHPVFCTTEVSDIQWARFALADPKNPSRRSYVEITSKTSDSGPKPQQQRPFEHMKHTNDGQHPTDLLDHTTDQIYHHWTHHLRPNDNNPGPYPLSAFTFIILDSVSLSSSPMSCLICTTAPDFSQPSPHPVLNLYASRLLERGI